MLDRPETLPLHYSQDMGNYCLLGTSPVHAEPLSSGGGRIAVAAVRKAAEGYCSCATFD